jgi:hypothetical protein
MHVLLDRVGCSTEMHSDTCGSPIAFTAQSNGDNVSAYAGTMPVSALKPQSTAADIVQLQHHV